MRYGWSAFIGGNVSRFNGVLRLYNITFLYEQGFG